MKITLERLQHLLQCADGRINGIALTLTKDKPVEMKRIIELDLLVKLLKRECLEYNDELELERKRKKKEKKWL